MTSDQSNSRVNNVSSPQSGVGGNKCVAQTNGCDNNTCKQYDDREQHAEEQILMAPYAYLCEVPGKQIREKLTRALNHWLVVSPQSKLTTIAEIVQMLHNASLMIDDIEDGSILRRGIPVTHEVYGVPTTINSANLVYFRAMAKCQDELASGAQGHPEALQIFIQQMIQLHEGQGMEIHWRDSFTCPTEEQYIRMVKRKTGGLFRLALGLMQLFSGNKTDYSSFIDDLGVYFQIRDDYANVCSTEYADAKTYAEDLTEGKFSFPIIHALTFSGPDQHSNGIALPPPADHNHSIHRDPRPERLLNILRQKPTQADVKRYAVQLLKDLGSLDYTVEKLKMLEARLLTAIESLGGNTYLVAVIEELRKIYS